MKIDFTRHARERCRQRGIRFRNVRLAVESPDQVLVVAGGAIEVTKRIGGRTLAVLFTVQREKRTIITAFYAD